MAKIRGQKTKVVEIEPETAGVAVPKWHEAGGSNGELDPKEEKMLDGILKVVVIFVLGWLALGILMSIGGLFHLWG